jgi:hypothetical protein
VVAYSTYCNDIFVEEDEGNSENPELGFRMS